MLSRIIVASILSVSVLLYPMHALRSSQREVGDHKSYTPQTPLLPASVSVDIKEEPATQQNRRLALLTAAAADRKTSESAVQIVIEAPTSEPEPEIDEPDLTGIEQANTNQVIPAADRQTSTHNYLAITGLLKDIQSIIASYLASDWFCIYMLHTGNKQHDALVLDADDVLLTSDSMVRWRYMHANRHFLVPELNRFKTFSCTSPINDDFNIVKKFASSSDGRYIATNSVLSHMPSFLQLGKLHVYAKSGKQFGCIAETDLVKDSPIAISPNGTHIAARSLRALSVWNMDSKLVADYQVDPMDANTETALVFSPDARSIAYTGQNHFGILPLDNTRNNIRCELPQDLNCAVISLAYKPDGSKLIAGSYDMLIIYDVTKNRFKIYPDRARNGANPNKWVRSLICTDNKIMYAVDTKIHILETSFPKLQKDDITRIDNHRETIQKLFLVKNAHLMTLAPSGTFRLWKNRANIEQMDLAETVQITQTSQLTCCEKFMQLSSRHPLKCRVLYAACAAGILLLLITWPLYLYPKQCTNT